MGKTAQSIYEAAMALPDEERAELADRLLDSLPAPFMSELHPSWKAELKRRSDEIEKGEVSPIPWEEVKRAAWNYSDTDTSSPNG